MITDALLGWLLAILNFFHGLLPSWNLQPDDSTVKGARGALMGVDWFVPAHELIASFIALGTFFVILLSLWGMSYAVRRIADVIP